VDKTPPQRERKAFDISIIKVTSFSEVKLLLLTDKANKIELIKVPDMKL
jgi:hypothetical protein